MWYTFDLYDDHDKSELPTDCVMIYARNINEAWEKVSEYAYDHNYCDFDLAEIRDDT